MELIGEILSSSMTGRQVDSILVTAYWAEVLENICYDKREETKAIKWWDGVLTVNVCTSQIIMELQMKEVVLLEIFADKFGEGVVERIRYRVGRI